MKASVLLLGFTLLFATDISGTYVLQTIIENGKTTHPNTEVRFQKDGKYYMMGAPFGEWKSGKGNSVYLNTAFEPKFERYQAVIHPDKMILQSQKGKMIYKKLNRQKALAKNHSSYLLGSWEYRSKNRTEKISFTKPNGFSCVEIDKSENTTTKGSGTWLFDKQSVTITAFGCSLNGKYELKKEKHTLFIGQKPYRKIK